MTPRAEAPPRRLDTRLRTSIVAVLVSGAALAAGALLTFGVRAGFSAGAGALIAAANLWVLARVVAGLLPEESAGARAQSRAAWALVALLKLLALLAVVWLLMRHAAVSPLALLVGYGSLPIGIAIGSLVSDRSAD